MNNSEKSVYQGWAFKLIVINVIVFVLQLFFDIAFANKSGREGSAAITLYLGLVPALIVEKGFLWQIFSYMFLHANFWHIAFNMYALFIFGSPIENVWGSKKFLIYYLGCGVFAGITIFVINFISNGQGYFSPTIGASGAVYGLLLAFGMLFPDVQFVFPPVRAKYLVFIYGGIELFLQLQGGTSNISHLGHLGGLAGGLLFFFFMRRRSLEFKTKIKKAIKKKKVISDHSDTQVQKTKINIDDIDYQMDILKRLKENGPESLSDDDIQYIKYVEIMSQENDEKLCNEIDFNIEDQHCKNCENFRSCFIREVKKYL